MPIEMHVLSARPARLDADTVPWPAVADIASIRPPSGVRLRAVADVAPSARRRTRIWELHHSLYCSIIGTCLSAGELRRILLRLEIQGVTSADDHGVHQLGVLLAGNLNAGAKYLQKSLDRLHKRALDQFAKARDEASLGALWDDAVKRGDFPGAYWAALTHPSATEALVKRVFGEIHMLSHLVGAANRADIVRLRKLEQENNALAETLERQQQQLRDGFVSRDATIRRLTEALARQADGPAAAPHPGDAAVLSEALAERDRRLLRERARHESFERRLQNVVAERDKAVDALRIAESEIKGLRAELASAEYQIEMLVQHGEDDRADILDLRNSCVLYVGARAHQIPDLRALVERSNGRFLHHDGGLEHNFALLPALVSRADAVFFPVDCIGHKAVAALKRSCQQLEKRYVPLRTSSLTCLLSGLAAERIGIGATNSAPPDIVHSLA